MGNNNAIQIGSIVEYLDRELGGETQKIMIVPTDFEPKVNNLIGKPIKIDEPLAQALLGAKKDDKILVRDNEPYEINVLDVKNLSLREFLKLYYTPKLESKLLKKDDEIIPFPFAKRLYIGFKDKHICQKKQFSWETTQFHLYHNGGKKVKTIHICKYCGEAILEGHPYQESAWEELYLLYDLNDKKRLNSKKFITPTQEQIQYWQNLTIQGGGFTPN